MNIVRKLFAWGGLALAVFLVLAFIHPMYRQGEASIAGKTAADFSLTLSNKTMRLSDLRGKVVVLNFWASWCPPCVEETPALNRLQQHIAGRGGMVLGVSADGDPSAYERFLIQQKVEFPTYRDPAVKDNISKIGLEYGTSMIPETYIIDRNGKIARKVIGPQQWDSPEMLAYLNSILSGS
jgi:cytochrome c biogenesis protein CcmG/thiol:disulfide interchange protein DsbE